LKERLMGIAEGFLGLRGELIPGVNGIQLTASSLGEGVFSRCFKAIGLLASINLQRLDMRSVPVVDLTPLANLLNLRWLYLRGTQVTNLTPLAALVNLSSLFLRETPVVDVSPLANLVKLEFLDLASTKVVDLTRLTALVRLQFLDLRGTEADETPLKDLTEEGLIIM